MKAQRFDHLSLDLYHHVKKDIQLKVEQMGGGLLRQGLWISKPGAEEKGRSKGDGGCLLSHWLKRPWCVKLPGRDEEIIGFKQTVYQPMVLLKRELVCLSVIISFYPFLLHLLYKFHKKSIPAMTPYDKPLSKETCLVYCRG